MEKYTQSWYKGEQFPGNCQLLPLRCLLSPLLGFSLQAKVIAQPSESQGMYTVMYSYTFDRHCWDDACSHLVVPCHQCHRPEHTRNQASWMVPTWTPHGEVAFPAFGQKCLLGGMLYIRYVLMVNVLDLWKTKTPDAFYIGRCSGCPESCSQGHNPHSCPGSQRRFQNLGQSPNPWSYFILASSSKKGTAWTLQPFLLHWNSSSLRQERNSYNLQDSESKKVTRFTRHINNNNS